MKQIKALIITATIASALVSLPPFLGVSKASEEASITVASCEGECGYAVVDDAGVVHGVIVCEEGCFDGVMPVDYMGCPAGCSLVFQAPADASGNVVGVHGPDVIYTPDNNTFSRSDGNGETWTHIGGQPFDIPAVDIEAPDFSDDAPINEGTPSSDSPSEDAPDIDYSLPIETPVYESPEAPVDETPEVEPTPQPDTTSPPAVESPAEYDESEILDLLVEYLTTTPPSEWPESPQPPVQEVIDQFYDYLRELVLSTWPDYFSNELNAR